MAEAIELYFSSSTEGTEDTLEGENVIWKDILREGEFKITPGRKQKRPFRVVAQGQSDSGKGVISMSDLHDGFDRRAFEDVTIPDGHPKPGESQLNNTGYVRALRTVKKKGKHYLQAAMGFTEPDVAGKVRRGTVPNVSSGVFFDFTRKADDTTFPCVLNHVALTKQPWVNDLEPFKRVFASDIDEDEVGEVASFEFAEEEEGGSKDDKNTGEIVWNEKDGSNWMREELRASLTPDQPTDPERPHVERPYYDVMDIAQSKNLALVNEWYKGNTTRFVVPFTVDGDNVTPAPQIRWTEGRDALIAAADDVQTVVNFEDMTVPTVLDRIGVALSDMFDDNNIVAHEVTLDRRVKVQDMKNNNWFVAEFSVLDNGKKVMLSPSDSWERIVAPADSASGRGSAPHSESKEIKLSDEFDLSTPQGRVDAARARRRELYEIGTKSIK